MQINPTSDQKSKANKMITVHQHKITVRGRTVLKLTAGVHSRVNGKTISETEIKETTRGNVKWKKKTSSCRSVIRCTMRFVGWILLLIRSIFYSVQLNQTKVLMVPLPRYRKHAIQRWCHCNAKLIYPNQTVQRAMGNAACNECVSLSLETAARGYFEATNIGRLWNWKIL